jgi:hypothetical protein
MANTAEEAGDDSDSSGEPIPPAGPRTKRRRKVLGKAAGSVHGLTNMDMQETEDAGFEESFDSGSTDDEVDDLCDPDRE